MKYCPECGTPTEGSNFCPECGLNLKEEAGQSEVESPEEDKADSSEIDSSESANEDNTPTSVILGKVVAWIFGVAIIWGGLRNILVASERDVVVGVIATLTGAFALPPVREQISKSQGIEFSRWMVVAIVIVGLFVAAIASPSDVDSSTTDGNNPSTDTPNPTATKEPVTVHDVNEEFVVGSGAKSVAYRVTDVSVQESVGSEFNREEADGVFVVVALDMENVGDETIDIGSDLFKLVDSQEREYETDSDAMFTHEDNIVYEQLDPGVEKSGVVIYDVPVDQSGRRLQIEPAGLFSGADPHYVRLGV